jgi:uncharacterized protein (TIGR04551 family)
MSRASLLLALLVALTSTPAAARIGFGDPAKDFREKAPDQWIVPRGHFRVRGALYGNLDLDRGVSPTTGAPLWPAGVGPGDWTVGGDMRLRLSPRFFLGDDVMVHVEVDVLDNVRVGASPRGTPYGEGTGVVAGTAFAEPLSFATGAFRLRTAAGQVNTPFGTLAAGRMPSHFGLGIAANAGDDLDDDGGDRADRIAFVTPLFGHFVAASFDWAASGAAGGDPLNAPEPLVISDQVQSVSVALLRFRAPWEAKLYRDAGRFVLDYGAAFSTQWQGTDTPGFYQGLDDAFGGDAARVRRDYLGLVLDVWLRALFGPIRIEAEAVASQFSIDNPSPWAGVEIRQPVTGNPVGAVVQVAVDAMPEVLEVMAEAGAASADPGFGFPLDGATPFAGSRPGDVKGTQLDGVRDTRMDAFRFHNAYRVDLIMWRTLLGGVSEAAYGRAKLKARPWHDLDVELGAISSHGLSEASTPGGRAPLGLEVDAAATLRFGAFSLRTDAGVLFPMGGLGARGGTAPGVAHMVLVRLGYEA